VGSVRTPQAPSGTDLSGTDRGDGNHGAVNRRAQLNDADRQLSCGMQRLGGGRPSGGRRVELARTAKVDKTRREASGRVDPDCRHDCRASARTVIVDNAGADTS
jgi:hypothetical protein